MIGLFILIFVIYIIGFCIDLIILDEMLETEIQRTGVAMHVWYSSMFWPYHWGKWIVLWSVNVVQAGFRESKDRWTEYETRN